MLKFSGPNKLRLIRFHHQQRSFLPFYQVEPLSDVDILYLRRSALRILSIIEEGLAFPAWYGLSGSDCPHLFDYPAINCYSASQNGITHKQHYGSSDSAKDGYGEAIAAQFISENTTITTSAPAQSPAPPSCAIFGVDGANFLSYRIRDGKLVDPFASQDDFPTQYFCMLWEPLDDRVRAPLAKPQSTQYNVCFTHGDITPTNILVDEQLRPIGLVDWEYTKATYIRRSYVGWCHLFRRIFPEYGDELE
ncbi:hypothetical protein DFS33DRAFT_128507 [Desarmillaria ectypa]|nr:hypothetical protein DFS33DRAFT_128507 [Desarmillaria ectypa]